MQLHFLSASDGIPLTKRFHLSAEELQKDSYPHVGLFNSHEASADTIEDFLVALAAHATVGHCLLKGQLDQPLKNARRAGHTNADSPTEWMVLDNDHLHHLAPQQLMDLLGLGDVDYIVQYSASAYIEPDKRGYHLFFLLDAPCSPEVLKLRLRAWNLDVPPIREHISLTRTGHSLRWPLDISVCQNDKLIYIAPAILGEGVQDPLHGKRIGLDTRSKRRATLPAVTDTADTLRQRETAVINELRQRVNLPARPFETRSVQGEIVGSQPDQAEVTGQKEEREFVYLNLNGGDSWGYYHPLTAPDILYNFKGEPNYLIEELLPTYHPHAVQRAADVCRAQQLELQQADMDMQTQRIRTAETTGTPFLQACRDQSTDQYYAGWIDPQGRTHALHPIGSKTKINDLFAQHSYPKPEVIPTVDFRFDPTQDALYDFDAGFINRYVPPSYLKNAQSRDGAEVPSQIARIVRHALGEDPDIIEHFHNWLATIFRFRERTQTAWILQGTTGTGKGMLFEQIIRPLIGESYCRMINLCNLEEQFNGFAGGTIVLFIDEVDTDQVKQMPKLMTRFKTWITEPNIALRAMRQDLRHVPNHLNLILSSNQPNSMRIEHNDRRFNVCPRQEYPLLAPGELGEDVVARIRDELPAYADYLMSRPADRATARRALDNAPKRLLQSVTQTAIEEVANALRHGDLAYFMDHRSPDAPGGARSALFDGHDVFPRTLYRAFLEAATAAAVVGTKQVIQHETLFAVFELLVGDMPKTKSKLTKRLGHQHLTIGPHTQGSISLRGLGVTWRVTPEQAAAWRQELADEAAATALVEHRPPRPRPESPAIADVPT